MASNLEAMASNLSWISWCLRMLPKEPTFDASQLIPLACDWQGFGGMRAMLCLGNVMLVTIERETYRH